jgi:two-component system, cell cycle sensor histidine kinase and response regulator CckA
MKAKQEAEAQENTAGLRIVTASARVGLVVVDKEHRYVFANAAYSSILGLPNELVGKRLADVLPDAYEERIRPRLDRAFAGARMDYELRIPTSAAPIHCAVNYEPVMEGNRVTSVAIVVMDISAQRNTEEQLRQSQKMEAVGQLAGGIAHDFNNLLTIISGYTNLLLKKLTPTDPNWNFLNEISLAGKRAADLTRSLLAFSHQQVRTPETVDLNEAIKETVNLLRRSIGEGVEINVVLAHDLKHVWIDRSELSQILLNLSINARDAMHDEGRMIIQTQNVNILAGDVVGSPCVAPGEYVLLTVSDSGSGMTDEVQRRIFEPFFTTKPVGKGTGLGLAMVHGIVSRSGGCIRVSSTVGVGTTFSIYLPQSTDLNRLPLNSSDAQRPQGGTETILLVEDSQAVRGLTRTILADYGYSVLEAANGQDALQIFSEHRDRIQLIISDVVMPGMNGTILVQQIRKLAPSLPVLFISGYIGENVVQESLIDNSVNFLQKPFAAKELALYVRKTLERQANKVEF